MLLSRRRFSAALATPAATAWALLSAAPARAQFRVEISGVGAIQLPIAITRFRDEDRAGQPLSAIVRADLERSGMFRFVESSGALDERSSPQFPDWRARGADALIVGSATRLADGRVGQAGSGGAEPRGFIAIATKNPAEHIEVMDQHVTENASGLQDVVDRRCARVAAGDDQHFGIKFV